MTLSEGKVFILFDIDGVVNALPDSDEDLSHWDKESWIRTTLAGVYDVCYSKDLVKELKELLTESRAQGMWCTTWKDRAVSILAPELGFGSDWDWIRETVSRNLTYWWKIEGVKKLLDSLSIEDKVIWCDDDIKSYRNLLSYYSKTHEVFQDPRVLAVECESKNGLTPKNLEEMRRFLSL